MYPVIMGLLNYCLTSFRGRVFLLSCFLLGFTPNLSFAWNFFGGAAVSAASGSVSTASESDPPKVNVYTAGVFLGARVFRFFLIGARASYSRINQFSAATAQTGNRTGTRTMPFAPLFGVDFKFAKLQTDYQRNGDYELTNTDSSGRQITYKKPSGLGVELIFPLTRRIDAGVRYEKVNFSQEQVGSNSATTLANQLSLKSYGVVFECHF